MREKRFLSKPATCTSGITPVCAGKTSVSCLAGTVTPGSPPRVREKLGCDLLHGIDRRITPACAGKTFTSLVEEKLHRDHPRVCGKNDFALLFSYSFSGSPPRVREKPKLLRHNRRNFRITPASAGKTMLVCLSGCHLRDHPRECGKNGKEKSVASNPKGSPPRVREKLMLSTNPLAETRITPASAGKTLF